MHAYWGSVLQERWTALHLAALSGCFNVVRALVQRGASVDAKGKVRQITDQCA